MKSFSLARRYYIPLLAVMLLAAMLVSVFGCEDYSFPQPTPPEEQEAETAPASIKTRDAAMLAVYQHLLEQAKTDEAKLYLADFYATSDNWSAEDDYFKDGSGVWYIEVDMTGAENWQERPHWQQASWFVFQDGRVVPSYLLDANALRIEADIQSLSGEAEPAE